MRRIAARAWPVIIMRISITRFGGREWRRVSACCYGFSFVVSLTPISDIVVIVGEVANFAAYTFAPPILVTPLGALSVLIGAILASFILKEELGRLGRVGCTLCLVGTLIIILNAPEDREITTVDEILNYAIQPGELR